MKNINNDKLNDSVAYYEAFNRESPRGLAIMVSAQLKALLQNVINKHLNIHPSLINKIKVDDLENFYGVIESAYSLGLINVPEHDDLHIIRLVRNEFAHSLYDLSFDSEIIFSLCKNFKHIIPFDHFPDTPFIRFAVASAILEQRIQFIMQRS